MDINPPNHLITDLGNVNINQSTINSSKQHHISVFQSSHMQSKFIKKCKNINVSILSKSKAKVRKHRRNRSSNSKTGKIKTTEITHLAQRVVINCIQHRTTKPTELSCINKGDKYITYWSKISPTRNAKQNQIFPN